MSDLEVHLRDLVEPTTARPAGRDFAAIDRDGRARADRRRRMVVATGVAAVGLVVVASLAIAGRAERDDVASVAPLTPSPASEPPPVTVNPSITTGASGSEWAVRITFDPTRWTFASLSQEVQGIVTSAVRSTSTFPGGWGMADERGQAVADVYFAPDPGGLQLARAVADDLQGRPGISSVEIQTAHAAPR